MKILEISPYISTPEQEDKISGFGLMVYSIFKSLKMIDCDVNLFTYKNVFKGNFNNELINVNKLSLFYYFKFNSIKIAYRLNKKYHFSTKREVKLLLYFTILYGFTNKIIKNSKYDVIHIHGCSIFNIFIEDICKKLDIHVLVTFHGLNIYNEIGPSKLSSAFSKFEKDYISDRYKNNLYSTIVSTGCLDKIMFNNQNMTTNTNFTVIPNGCDIDLKSDLLFDIRQKYSIPQNAIILLYVGNICERKNQLGFVHAFENLPQNIIEKIYVLFLGKSLIGEEYICNKIKNSKYCKHFILCGNIPQNQMYNYYRQADRLALLSFHEGFGLGLIEALSFGLPILAVSDMEAIKDIYINEGVVLIKDRTIQSIKNGIIKLYKLNFDKENVMNLAKKFNMKNISKLYYNQLLKTYKNSINE